MNLSVPEDLLAAADELAAALRAYVIVRWRGEDDAAAAERVVEALMEYGKVRGV